MTLGEVKQLNAELQQQIQEVFEELTHQVQEKDSLASELHVRHVAIEQLLKNYSKLPCLQMGRTGLKSHLPINNWTQLTLTSHALPFFGLLGMLTLKKLKKVMVNYFMVIKFAKIKAVFNMFAK